MAGPVTWHEFYDSPAGSPQSEKESVLKITKPRG